MQHLDNDMDDLFRRAAEGYPLNTGSADWAKVQAQLMPENERNPAFPQRGRQRWLLLLLLPFVLLCNQLSDALVKPHTIGTADSQSTRGTAASPVTKKVDGTFPPVALPFAGKRQRQRSADRKQDNISSLVKNTSRHSRPSALPNADRGLQPSLSGTVSRKNKNEPATANDISASDVSTPSTAEQPLVKNAEASESKNIPERENTSHQDSSTKQPVESTMPQQKGSVKKEGRFFVSLVAGPDVTTVKFQQFSDVGSQAGVLLGYRISNRLALEAGVLSVKKYYKSDGEYLNKAKIYLPANTEIVAIDGSCRMIELPVMLQYTFHEGKKKSFFASAGLSSYLMKRESYNYDYLYLSSGNVVTHQKTYENQSRNWVSVLQLSAGVFSRLGKFGHLRIEPYYALPLRGIGYGELPLSSLGVQFGITSPRF